MSDPYRDVGKFTTNSLGALHAISSIKQTRNNLLNIGHQMHESTDIDKINDLSIKFYDNLLKLDMFLLEDKDHTEKLIKEEYSSNPESLNSDIEIIKRLSANFFNRYNITTDKENREFTRTAQEQNLRVQEQNLRVQEQNLRAQEQAFRVHRQNLDLSTNLDKFTKILTLLTTFLVWDAVIEYEIDVGDIKVRPDLFVFIAIFLASVITIYSKKGYDPAGNGKIWDNP